MLILIIYLNNFLGQFQVEACPYNSNSEALISDEYPLQENIMQIPILGDNSFDSFGFGFWSQCQPLFEPKYYPNVDYQFAESLPQDGQLLMTVYGTSYMILLFAQFDDKNLKVIHKIFLFDSYSIQEVDFNFPPIEYEGLWVYTFITIQKDQTKKIQVKLEMTDQNIQSRYLDIHENTQQWVYLGGRGHILGWFNLNIFRGRITKLYINQGFNWNGQTFAQMSKLCSLPFQQEGQILLNDDQLTILDGSFLFKNSINQVGSNYYLSGWIKLDLSQIIMLTSFTIIRITAFETYQNGFNDGDGLFIMYVVCDEENQINTQIILLADMHKIPLKGQIGQYSNKMEKVISDYNSNKIYQGLNNWFFIQYEYGRKSSHKHGYFSIQFFNKAELIQIDLGDDIYGGSFRNTKLYIFVGGEDYNMYFMIGQTFHLQFTYNYVNDRDSLEIPCHYSCLTCKGPMPNNCLSCQSKQNRIYLEDQNICQCPIGTIENDSTKICIPLDKMFTNIEKVETKYDQLFCKFGYFLLPNANNEFNCLQCPQQNNEGLLCIECYFQPLTWYKDPHCRYDLISIRKQQADALKQTQRDPNYYDQYLIDEFGVLFLKIGVQDICFNDCYQTSFTHLKQSISINCKKNFVYENGECYSSIDNCQLAQTKNICQYCVDGMEIKNNQCVPCGNHCILCNYLGSGVCQQCEKDYQLIDNQCMKCGSNCKTCRLYNDVRIKKTYLKCFQCKDDSKYFLSFDGINCLQNTIQNCKYAFRSLKSNIKFNTLEQNFIPQFDQNQIETHCARCQTYYIYIYESKVCLRGNYFSCQFGFAQKFTVYDPQNPIQYSVTDGKYLYSTSQQFCLINWYHDNQVFQFSQFCSSFIPYCAICIVKWNYNSWNCLICLPGYYAERLTSKCRSCPQTLNCLQCYQEQILSRDSWKYQIRAAYKRFIDFNNDHTFFDYGQSLDQEDYQIQCKLCNDGYDLYEHNCIQSCPKTCAECQIINSKNICVRCFMTEKGVQLTLYDNQCLDCPENCQLCRQRTQEEISSINPIFNTTYNELEKYSYQCLKSFQDQEYFYDSQIGQYITCQNSTQGCEKQYNMNFNLYCSIDEFNKDLNSLNDYEQDQFLQHNLLINQAGSLFLFEKLNTYNFYKMANQESIKVLNIYITSQKQQNCQILKESLFNQQFSQQIFSAINVSLTIEGQGKTVFELHQSIGFYNFSQITLSGLILESISNSINTDILFDSLFKQKIALKNIEFKQNSQQIAMIRMNINQVYDLEIANLIFNRVNQSNNHSTVYIQSTIYSKKLSFKNIQLIDSNLTNQNIFQVDAGDEDKIIFTNFSIFRCTFQNSSLIQAISEKGSLILQNFQFRNITISKTLSFIDLSILDLTYIDQVSFINSSIIDSIILLINQNSQITDLLIQQNNFQAESFGILNKYDDSIKQDQNFMIQNLKIIGNNYSINGKYILFRKNINLLSNLQITNLQVFNNQISNTSQSQNEIPLNSSLINIQMDNIVIKDSTIHKGYGINLIFIYNAKTVKIDNLEIQQDEHFHFKTLHSSMDCLYKQIPGKLFTSSIILFSVQNLDMKNIIIQNAILIDSPIIYYKSEDTFKSIEKEILSFNNVTMNNNVLLLTNPQIRSSLIFIQSTQNIIIQFSNVSIKMNILQEYQQDQSFETALTLNLDVPFGSIQLLNSSFLQNQIFNASSSLMYIRSSKLNIINCDFKSNNLFSFEIMKQYIFWPFDILTEVYLEDIINQFPIKSLSGNGKFEVEQFSLLNCNIENSFGSNGAGFYLIANKFSQFRIENSQFKSLRTYFKQTGEQGGAFYIDGSQASQINFLFENLQITNLSSRSQGGFIYIKVGAVQSSIILKEILVQNVFSLFGSFLYIEFQKNMNEQQEVQVDRITINQNYTEWKNFLNKFKNIIIFEKNSLINDRSLIYIGSASKVHLSVLYFYNIYYEQAIVLDNINTIFFERLYLIDCSVLKNMIAILPSLYSKFYIAIDQIFGKNINFGSIQINQNDICLEDQAYSSKFKQWPCQISTHFVPSELNYKNLESLSTANCLIQYMANEILMNQLSGLFILKSESNSNTLKMKNIFLTNIDCANCQNGLIFFSISGSDQLLSIATLQIQNCKCGQLGCLVVENKLQTTRILDSQDQLIMKKQLNLSISNYICNSNIATNGTCLYLIKSKAIIQNSIFTNNTANVAGGAIYIENSQNVFIIKCIIEGNYAIYGGGIYLQDLQQLLYQKLSTLVYQNIAKEFSDDISTIPSNLKVSLGLNNALQLMTDIFQTQTILIETQYLSSTTYAYGIKSKCILLPNGQKISDYKIFDWKTQSYRYLNLELRLKAYDAYNNQIKGLKNSYCELRQRIYDVTNSNSNTNFSDASKIYFNETTSDYNLDDQIFYFDDGQPTNLVLQLQFYCNKIVVPQYDENFPYQITSSHNNYFLRLNVRSFPCQLGEIKNTSMNFCQTCDSEIGLFSLKLNQSKCQIKDDISTISVTPVQLQLRPGFWRPFFSSISIVECYNLQGNCLGGWAEGNSSCYHGHIGALCEQCDIYNIRGDGHFSINSKFKCGSCVDKWKNMTFIVFISIWAILSIIISVYGTIKSLQENVIKTSLRFTNQISIIRTVQSAILIKMLTNYFQIISSITSFRLDISITLQSIISAAGSPIQPLLYSLDCFLIDMFNFEILYAKMTWQLIMPFIYIIVFFILYMVALKLQLMKFNKSSITTSIIYVYIYFQPSLVGELIGLISYRDISDQLWVSSNVSYTYNTQQHFLWMIKFCFPLIILLAISIPLFLFFILIKNKKKFTEKSTKLFWGYLYIEYTEQAFFWEILKIVAKELIIVALTFYDDYIVLKAMIVQFILLIYLKFNKRFQPYKNIKLNSLDYQSIYVCLISFSLAIGCFITQQQNILEVNTIQIGLIIIFNVHLLLVFLKSILGEIAFEINQKYSQQLDEVRIYLRRRLPVIDKYHCLRKYFQSQQEKKQKVYQNFKKLKEYALPKVKEILILKSQGINNNSKSSNLTFINLKSLESMYHKNQSKERERKQLMTTSILLKGEGQERLPFHTVQISNIRERSELNI